MEPGNPFPRTTNGKCRVYWDSDKDCWRVATPMGWASFRALTGKIGVDALSPGAEWPELHRTYDEMVEAKAPLEA